MDPLSEVNLATFQDLQQAMGDDYIEEMVDAFCQDASSLIAGLKQAQKDADPLPFSRHAHSLKSTSLTFGALAFADLARELEHLGKAGCLDEVTAQVAQLDAACSALFARLKALCHE